MIRWPDGLEAESFLRRYWQKVPLLLPGGIDETAALPSPEELAGLACEPEVESRIVSGDGKSGWKVRHGPFREHEFLDLPETGWTLLVQDVEKHVPSLARLLDRFDFVPRWRLDDLMISYAAPGGSVGPHVDAYDVFLIQAPGSRVWELDPRPADISLREDSDLAVLRSFVPATRYRLEPGDMLYLPPGVAHFGYSTEPSMTCSVGFRSPSASELLAAAGRMCEETANPRYVDADLTSSESRDGRIPDAAVERLRQLLASATAAAETNLDELLGRLVTEGKPWLLPEPAAESMDTEEILRGLHNGASLARHPGSRFAWSTRGADCRLFVDGQMWELPGSAAPFCRRLSDGGPLDGARLGPVDHRTGDVLRALLACGSLLWDDKSGDIET